MSKKWPGGIITPTPATPSGPYQDGAAPGVWTLSQQSYWAKQGLWPIAGNAKPFDETRILIPYRDSSYTAGFYLYDWATDSLTSLGSQSQFYPAGNAGNCNIVIDPSKNIWLFGAENGTTTQTNFMYLAAGSTTPSYYRVVPTNYATYGPYFSQITWNPTVDRCQAFTFPHYNVSSTAKTFTFDSGGNIYDEVSGGPDGWQNPGLALLTTKSSTGTITQGSYIVGVGDDNYDVSNSFIWSDAAPWSSASWTQSTQITGNASRSWVIGLSASTALVVCFGNTFVYDADANTWSDVTSALANAGGVSESINRGLTGLWDDVYCCYQSDAIKVVKGDPTGTISWCTSLTSEFSGKTIYMAWGVGYTLYVLTAQNPWRISKVVFSADGSYTITNRDFAALTSTSYIPQLSGLQYF